MVIKEKYVENFKLYFFASACLCMWEYVWCIIVECVNAWQDREQYGQFGLDIISRQLVRIIKAMLQRQRPQASKHRTMQMQILSITESKRKRRHKHTWLFISFMFRWWLNNYSSVKHQMLTCNRLPAVVHSNRILLADLLYWPVKVIVLFFVNKLLLLLGVGDILSFGMRSLSVIIIIKASI